MPVGIEQDREAGKALTAEWLKRTEFRVKLQHYSRYDNASLLREWVAECDSKTGNPVVAEAIWVLLEDRLIASGFLPAQEVGKTSFSKEIIKRSVAFRDGTMGGAAMIICGHSLLGERIAPNGGPDGFRLYWDGSTLTYPQVQSRLKVAQVGELVHGRVTDWLSTGRLLRHGEESSW